MALNIRAMCFQGMRHFKMSSLLMKYPPVAYTEPVVVKKTTKYTSKKKKKPIPAALREAVWIKHMGRNFQGKCMTRWCKNMITVFEFQAGHDIPESKGGATDIMNLYPICARCNLSMSNNYTFKEWCALGSSEATVPVDPVPVAPVPVAPVPVAPAPVTTSLFHRLCQCFK